MSFAEVEDAVASDDYVCAVETAAVVFEIALERWCDAHAFDVEFAMYGVLDGLSRSFVLNWFDAVIGCIECFMVILLFASDLSEFIWLESKVFLSVFMLGIDVDDAE